MNPNNVPLGPGAIADQGESPPELLEKVGDSHYVTVLNPLPSDFYGMVGVDKPVNEPFTPRQTPNVDLLTRTEDDITRNYGLNLKNKDYPSKRHITHTIILPAGQTINLLGGQAKTVVRQLVTAVLQYQQKKLLLADRFARRQIEEQVVVSVSSVADILGQSPQTPQQQAMQAVNKLNEVTDEPEFPEVTLGAGDREVGSGESQPTVSNSNPATVSNSTPDTTEPVKAKRRTRGSQTS